MVLDHLKFYFYYYFSPSLNKIKNNNNVGTINSQHIKCFKRLPFQIKLEQLQVVVLQQSAAILKSLFAEHSLKPSTWKATSALLLPAGAGNQFIYLCG